MGLSDRSWERQADAVPASAADAAPQPKQSPEELQEEGRRIRRFQLMMTLVMQVIAQDESMTVEEDSAMVADTRRAALVMFPDKELAFNLNYWTRMQRLMLERYRMQ